MLLTVSKDTIQVEFFVIPDHLTSGAPIKALSRLCYREPSSLMWAALSTMTYGVKIP